MGKNSRQSAVGSQQWPDGKGLPGECGIILIALLWIFVALAAIVLSFARESRVEIATVRNTQSLEKAYYIARAGVAETIYRIAQDSLAPQTQQSTLVEDQPTPLERGVLTAEFGDGQFRADIQDESGKVDVNNVAEDQLLPLILATGIPEADASVISDSILDWRDSDDFSRANGAESEYYQALETPYAAKNGRINAIEELLLVRGVTPEYFYGLPEKTEDGNIVYKYGLARCFTVYSNSSSGAAGAGRIQINVNYAPLPVLLAIPGMTQDTAERIIANRPFQDTRAISDAIPGSLSSETLQYLSTQLTNIYTLNVTASVANSKVRRVIRTIVRLDTSRPNYHQILYWNENVPDYEGANL
jgi:general secretion pathway protein K